CRRRANDVVMVDGDGSRGDDTMCSVGTLAMLVRWLLPRSGKPTRRVFEPNPANERPAGTLQLKVPLDLRRCGDSSAHIVPLNAGPHIGYGVSAVRVRFDG